MEFIDLFAGLGGFHKALADLGHKCVFASEINLNLSELYEKNFKIKPYGDIKTIAEKDIPSHNILCAGFPCQPFSQAGYQKGLKDKKRGNFLNDIVRILKYHKPNYFILENVPHLRKHDDGKTWEKIFERLHFECGYEINEKNLSPHEFGVPQIRKRLFIVGKRGSLDYFKWPSTSTTVTDINNILESNPVSPKKLSEKQLDCLYLWQQIIEALPNETLLPGFPIWSTEFGATYPYENKATLEYYKTTLNKYKGSFGKPLNKLSRAKILDCLPIYSKNMREIFPDWKISYIRQNREFYKKNEKYLRPFIKKLKKFPFSWQKFEWNCGDSPKNIFKYIIQFRASGIRIKKTNFTPALVLTSTQIPIIGWEKRYITVKEAAKLQSLEDIQLPKEPAAAFKALGNAVNSKIVTKIALKLIENAQKNTAQKK